MAPRASIDYYGRYKALQYVAKRFLSPVLLSCKETGKKELDSPNSDFILSDNYFDLNAESKTVKILEGTPKTLTLRSVYDIR